MLRIEMLSEIILKKQYWKHEGGLYRVYHCWDTALCETDNQC